jgi:hypothetical protein
MSATPIFDNFQEIPSLVKLVKPGLKEIGKERKEKRE